MQDPVLSSAHVSRLQGELQAPSSDGRSDRCLSLHQLGNKTTNESEVQRRANRDHCGPPDADQDIECVHLSISLAVVVSKHTLSVKSFAKKLVFQNSIGILQKHGGQMTQNERIRWQRRVNELEHAVKLWMALTGIALMFLFVSLVRGLISL